MLPERKIAVVWMANGEWLPNTGAISHATLDVTLLMRCAKHTRTPETRN
jgi:hypothetical protein